MLVWLQRAIQDRDAQLDYIAQDNPQAALKLDEDFSAKVDIAAQRPTLYKPGRVQGTREIVVRPNYIMVYRMEDSGDTLVVLRVLHAAQQWPAR